MLWAFAPSRSPGIPAPLPQRHPGGLTTRVRAKRTRLRGARGGRLAREVLGGLDGPRLLQQRRPL